ACWINGRGQALGSRQRKLVDASCGPPGVLENACLGLRAQNRPQPCDRVGLAELFKVYKEESSILPIEKFRNADWPADAAAELMEQRFSARRFAFILVIEFVYPSNKRRCRTINAAQPG